MTERAVALRVKINRAGIADAGFCHCQHLRRSIRARICLLQGFGPRLQEVSLNQLRRQPMRNPRKPGCKGMGPIGWQLGPLRPKLHWKRKQGARAAPSEALYRQHTPPVCAWGDIHQGACVGRCEGIGCIHSKALIMQMPVLGGAVGCTHVCSLRLQCLRLVSKHQIQTIYRNRIKALFLWCCYFPSQN